MRAPHLPLPARLGRRSRFLRLLIAGLAVVVFAASCGDDGDPEVGDELTADDTTQEAAATEANNGSYSPSDTTTTLPTTEAPVETAPEWVAHEDPAECQRADGSDYWVTRARAMRSASSTSRRRPTPLRRPVGRIRALLHRRRVPRRRNRQLRRSHH